MLRIGRPDDRPPVAAYDLARAGAALAVLVAHARGFVLADLPDQPHLPTVGRAFFAITALGHQAVVVFFVLSGLLVTTSAFEAIAAGRWSAHAFAATRLNRLWLVLLPCLLVGGVEDRLSALFLPVGATANPSMGVPGLSGAPHTDAATALINVMFLQTFHGPVFGTNVPLWSLAIEAWCYAALLAVTLLIRSRHQPARFLVTAGVTLAIAATALTPAFWVAAPLWAMGAGLALVLHRNARVTIAGRDHAARTRVPRWAGPLLIVVVLVVVAAARSLAAEHLVVSDYLLAAAVAIVFGPASRLRLRDGILRRLVERVAGFSFTLYLAHYSLFALLDAGLLGHRRLAWGGHALAVWALFLLLGLLQAWGLWWLFERHTARLRRFWLDRLGPVPARLGTNSLAVSL